MSCRKLPVVQVHRHTKHWFADEDLTSVRGPEGLARLPPDERDAWTSLWAEVGALRDQTTPQSAATME